MKSDKGPWQNYLPVYPFGCVPKALLIGALQNNEAERVEAAVSVAVKEEDCDLSDEQTFSDPLSHSKATKFKFFPK